MKKILILDVDSCYFCPCSSAEVGWLGNITRSVCQVKGEENTVFMDGVSGLPKWCPLKPMPEKKVVTVNKIEDIQSYSITEVADKISAQIILKTDEVFALGWNACIDEITGETE